MAVLLVLVLIGPLLATQVAALASHVLDNFPAWTR